MEEKFNILNEKGKETGYWRISDGAYGLLAEGYYKDGERIGIWKTYDRDNNVTIVDKDIHPDK